MPLPNFIIVGETKCGTTSLYNNLIQHSHILPSLGNGENTITEDGDLLSIKELRFFDRHWNKGLEWYRNRFPQHDEPYITGEATPMYLYRTQAIYRMAQIIPNCKIIIMFRNPVDRLISHYYHLDRIIPNWNNKYPTITDYWNSASEPDYHLIDRGIYINSLHRLQTYFPNEQIHIIISEDMFIKPQSTYNKVLQFLGLPDEKLAVPKHSRQGKVKQLTQQDSQTIKNMTRFYTPYNIQLQLYLNRINHLWTSH